MVLPISLPMLRPPAIARRLRHDERGFTLLESLVAVVIFGFVLSAVLSLLDVSGKIVPRDQERMHAIRDGQVGLERMARELRSAYKVEEAASSAMHVLVSLNGVDRQVRYDCNQLHPDDPTHPHDQTYRRCRRVEAAIGAALPAPETGVVVIDRVLDPAVFTYSPGPINPSYVKARVEVPARGELKSGNDHRIVLDDGFYLRNFDLTD